MASEALQALVEQLRAHPIGTEEMSIDQIRANLEALASPAPEDVTCVALTANGVPAEWIAAPNAVAERVILYLHGGGYVLGSINSHRDLIARIARASEARVLAIDYRLAPEQPFPAAVEDATTAYRWLLANGVSPAKVVVAGDSAGGGLTVATLVALRDEGDPAPAAGVCLSPWVDLEGIGDSMTSKAEADPIVNQAMLQQMAERYLAGADPRTALAAPLYADLTGLPPLLIQVGTAETLLDDATRLDERARAAGVTVTLEPWEDMIHVWQMFAAALPEGQQAIERIGEFVRQQTAETAATPA